MTEHRSNDHGAPCWYELGTTDLAAAGKFYSTVLGWQVQDSGMEGMTYHLATAPDGAMVAGLSSTEGQDAPPAWCVYYATDGTADTTEAATQAGAHVIAPPMDVPGTGRFAILADPQGAVFGILQPEPMEDGSQGGRAFDMESAGHGGWHELMTPEPEAAYDFYAGLFGWTKGETLDMGSDGAYQLFQHGGHDIGGMMALGSSPVPAWLPYFTTDGVTPAMERITGNGGGIVHGPMEVPGGAHIAIASDPQGAYFAVLGPLG